MAVFMHAMFNDVSVAALAQAEVVLNVGGHGRIRPVLDSAGADIAVTVFTSVNGGLTWHELASYAVGAIGAQAIIDLPGPLVRMVAENGALIGAQSITARLVIERA